MNKEKLIPELRFPEFKNEGGWVIKELNDFCFSISSGKDKNSEVGKYELYGSTGIIGRTDNVSYTGEYILVARVGANAGLLNRAKGKFGVTDNTLVLDLKKVDIIDFIQYSLYKIGLNKLVFGSGQPLITGGQLKSLQIAAPKDDKEQQKIASCLSSLDETINAHSQKLDSLKDHKKGLMQNLFPQEGETVPKYRFKEFENDGEWVEDSIQKLIDKKIIVSHLDGNHGALYPKAEEFSKEGIPYISANDFISGLINFSKCKFLPVNKAKQFKKGVAKNGDILFAHNATVGPVAKLVTYYPYVILSTTATYFRCDNESLINDFLLYALSNPSFVKQYTRVMSQSTRNQVPITTQREFILHLPKPNEQQKIAYCLSSLDAFITAQAEKIAQLKLHKKGLMQGLFPKITD